MVPFQPQPPLPTRVQRYYLIIFFLPTNIFSPPGLFNEHHFPSPSTGCSHSTDKLIAPMLEYAVTRHPVGGELELWLACFIKSRLDGVKERQRPINLVVVLDVSGSMNDHLVPPKTE